MTTRSVRSIIAGLAFAGLITLGVMAQTNNQSTNQSSSDAYSQNASSQSGSSKLNSTDKQFVEKAAQGNEAEVELGQLAQQKGSSDDVKAFGLRMVHDHGRANDQLQALAQSKGMSLPSKPNREQQEQYNRLSKLSGEHFNAEYINTMTEDHSKDVSEYQQEMNTAQDPAVKNYVSVNLPIIQNHLVRAQNLPGKDIVRQRSGSDKGSTNPPQH